MMDLRKKSQESLKMDYMTQERTIHDDNTSALPFFHEKFTNYPFPLKHVLTTNNDANEETPIIRFLNQILAQAIQQKASDIHFEPYVEHCRVRFRQDGLLVEAFNMSQEFANRIIGRIKIISNLDISERRIPQDGRFNLKLTTHSPIDFRVSTCPTIYGEKVVIRLLDTQSFHFQIDSLGLDHSQLQMLIKAISLPQGMILVTGPTGSGKTVSLYAILNQLNTPQKNIMTIEDPVEIQLAGVNQVNVNLKIDLNFSKILRAFLRQDPDIMMIGEIRDLETAEVSIKAAQTGHLILSTLHTNHAVDTINRLLNMGITRFNITSSINLLVAQRLVRRLCEQCKVPQEKVAASDPIFAQSYPHTSQPITIFSAAGCDQCTDGYNGRLGVFEVMPLSESMKEHILSKASTSRMMEQAQEEGIDLLYEAGLNQVKKGLTSMEEINRVIGPLAN